MRASSNPSQIIGLLPLRLVIALVFLVHGGQKLFVYGIAGTTGAMHSMGIPMPQVAAGFVIAVELLGGLAILVVKRHGGFFSPAGIEFELTLLAGALTLALLAPAPKRRGFR